MSAIRIAEFDTWRGGYGGATVTVLQAGTTTPASIFTDEALSVAADNPQVLAERVVDGIAYGKFQVPLYVGVAYELEIDSVDHTGVVRVPLLTLDGEDASLAEVTPDGATEASSLEDLFARVVDVRDYGDWIEVGGPGASASTNNATLTAALGVAAASGGRVIIPAGTYQITSVTIGQGVVIEGAGRVATTLQSTVAGEIVTIGGARAGLSQLTLDGVTAVALSVGVDAANKDQIVLDDVEIKRLETGIYQRGGTGSRWRNLFISTCVDGYKAHGDLDGGNGGDLIGNTWTGGDVELCTSKGIGIELVDSDLCSNLVFEGIHFDTNTGTAVSIIGARNVFFRACRWDDNTVNLDVDDGDPETPQNTVRGLEVYGGYMDGGEVIFSGEVLHVLFRRVQLIGITLSPGIVRNNILAEDCPETDVTLAGTVPTSWLRNTTANQGTSYGLTTGTAAVKAWGITLAPGQLAYVEAKIIGRANNDAEYGFFHIVGTARRPPAELDYDNQTANFSAGTTDEAITGQTSGATAVVVGDTDAGSTGTLELQSIIGEFLDNEIITSHSGGSATVNGVLDDSAAVTAAGVADFLTPVLSANAGAWDATIVGNGTEVEVRVTGSSGFLVDWTVDVHVILSDI